MGAKRSLLTGERGTRHGQQRMGADELALRGIIRRLNGVGEPITVEVIELWGLIVRCWPSPDEHEEAV